MSTGDLAAILVPVLAGYLALVKLMLDTRRNARGANEAVNCRPADEPTLYEMVRSLRAEVAKLRRSSITRHKSNTTRLWRIDGRLEEVDNRLEALEERRTA